MSINVQIERLILEGIPVDATRNVRKTVERELARLLREGGLAQELRQDRALADVRAGTIRLGQDRHGRRLGEQVAGAVYRGIGPRP